MPWVAALLLVGCKNQINAVVTAAATHKTAMAVAVVCGGRRFIGTGARGSLCLAKT